MVTSHMDSNVAFEDYNQELVHSAHLVRSVENFDCLILVLAEHCSYPYAIRYHYRDFSVVDKNLTSVELHDGVVKVDFHNGVFAPHTMQNLVVVDQQVLLELSKGLFGSYVMLKTFLLSYIKLEIIEISYLFPYASIGWAFSSLAKALFVAPTGSIG